ncbi:MAG: lytic transglycosylase domain-containing protein [Chloroflexi bacterium]|nr:lytic transglycosylase domain-containing protein [Chloroflexota bacterium]
MRDARSYLDAATGDDQPGVTVALTELGEAVAALGRLLGRALRHAGLVLIALAWIHRRDLTMVALGALAASLLTWATAPAWYGQAGPVGSAPRGVVFAEAAPPSEATPTREHVVDVETTTTVPAATEPPEPPVEAIVWPAWMPDTVMRWASLAEASGRQHGVDPVLVAIVVLVESGGSPTARSHVGATGLMQVMPATAGDIASQRGMGPIDPATLSDPTVCVDFGAWYLSKQLQAFGALDDPDWQTSVERAAAAYNGGPGTAGKWLRGSALPNETAAYVRWVGGMWRERRDPTSPTLDAWRAAGGQVLLDRADAARVVPQGEAW